jgi:3-methyladenine DNA glycosylase AlkD
MTATEVLQQLKEMADPGTKKIHLNHGATEPLFGVKVASLKTLQKKIRKDHALSLALFETDNTDAMYLAGLIADEKKISKADLQQWVKKARWHMLSEYTVAWIAAESPFGFELGMQWIDDPKEQIAAAGWSTLSSVAAVTPDEQLDLATFEKLLKRVEKEIPGSVNRRRYTMNGFVIAVASFISPLYEKALTTAEKIGDVSFVIAGTACKVPVASDYIQKVAARGSIGKKKKMARC